MIDVVSQPGQPSCCLGWLMSQTMCYNCPDNRPSYVSLKRRYRMQQSLPSGIYPPLPTFFTTQDELDLATLRRHMLRIADSGIAGYVLMGTNGEAVHLTGDERAQVIVAAREVLGSSGYSNMPLIAGCGDSSTRVTIAYCQRAAHSGADFALVLPPFYYKGRMDSRSLLAHYRAVADNSPLPVLIYNM